MRISWCFLELLNIGKLCREMQTRADQYSLLIKQVFPCGERKKRESPSFSPVHPTVGPPYSVAVSIFLQWVRTKKWLQPVSAATGSSASSSRPLKSSSSVYLIFCVFCIISSALWEETAEIVANSATLLSPSWIPKIYTLHQLSIDRQSLMKRFRSCQTEKKKSFIRFSLARQCTVGRIIQWQKFLIYSCWMVYA